MPDSYPLDEWQADEWDDQARPLDGDVDAWDEQGSDLLMDFDVLARVKREAIEAELERARRIARRAE